MRLYDKALFKIDVFVYISYTCLRIYSYFFNLCTLNISIGIAAVHDPSLRRLR
jgi:hypothetical protein